MLMNNLETHKNLCAFSRSRQNKKNRLIQKRNRDNLKSSYIKGLLNMKDPPHKLVTAKKQHLKITRLLRELK